MDPSAVLELYGLPPEQFTAARNKNAGALRKALSPYISVGRRVRTSRGVRGRRVQLGPDAKTIKEWARANGYEVADRGRVPNEIREAFEAAN